MDQFSAGGEPVTASGLVSRAQPAREMLAELKREHEAQRLALVDELRRLLGENEARSGPHSYAAEGYRRRLATYEDGY
jgi:hypothetical protein